MLGPIRSYKNFHEFWLKRLEIAGDLLCLTDGENPERKFTYSQMNDHVDSTAFLLRGNGLKKKDRFVVLMDNCPEFFFLYLASMKLGTLIVPVAPNFSEEEILAIIDRFKPVLIFADLERRPLVQKLQKARKFIRKAFYCDADNSDNSENNFSSIISSLGKVDISYEDVRLDDPGSLYCSSGTTGKPKGIPQSPLNLLSAAESLNKAYGFGSKDTQMGILPIYHTALATYGFWPGVFAGSNFILFKKFSRKKFWQDIDRYKIAFVETVPTILSMLLNSCEDISKYDISSLRFIGSGSAPLSSKVWKGFEDRFGVSIANKYGLSETEPTHFNPPEPGKRKNGSIGKALGVCEVKVFNGKDLEQPAGEVGELVMRGDNVVNEYFEDQEETKKVFRNQWFYSGDLGYKDADGFFFLVGRKKEIIIRGGINIYPAEIDNILLSYPEVLEAVSFGLPDEIYGEEVYAVVKLKSQSVKNPGELTIHCQKYLAKHKCPKKIFIRDTIPKTASGKPRRRELVEIYKGQT